LLAGGVGVAGKAEGFAFDAANLGLRGVAEGDGLGAGQGRGAFFGFEVNLVDPENYITILQ